MTPKKQITVRMPYRVDTPTLPPLFCRSEDEALSAAEARHREGRGESALHTLVAARDGSESFHFWRTAP